LPRQSWGFDQALIKREVVAINHKVNPTATGGIPLDWDR